MFKLNHLNRFHVGAPGGEVSSMHRIAAGIESFEPQGNEDTDDTAYLDGEGMATTDIVGGALGVGFEGHRFWGDEAQDFIYDLMLQYNEKRVVEFSWTMPDGTTIKGPATLMNVEGLGGSANEKGAVSFELRFRGMPTKSQGQEPGGVTPPDDGGNAGEDDNGSGGTDEGASEPDEESEE